MKKILTIFERDETKQGHPVTDLCKSECLWVFHDNGRAFIKIDGTNVKVENGELLKRQKPKERDYDDASYIPCHRSDPSDRWVYEAYDAGHEGDGIYELVGPKIQGNPQGHVAHTIIRVVPPAEQLAICMNELRSYGVTFDGLKRWLTAHPVEGIVFHHPDGRMAKIKRRDFGLQWPVPVDRNESSQSADAVDPVGDTGTERPRA